MGLLPITCGTSQLVPAFLGISLGLLVVTDLYLGNILGAYFASARFIKVIPFGVFMLVCSLAITLYFLIKNINKAVETREVLFIILLIIGLQSVGLFPGRIDGSDLFLIFFIVFWLISVFATEKYNIVGSPLNLLNLVLLLFTILSAINAGPWFMIKMAPLLKAMLTSFLIIDIVRRKEWVIFFIKALVVITTFSAIIGIFQEILFLYNGTILAQYNTKYLNLMLQSTPFGTFLRVPAFTSMHLYLANYLVLCLLIGFNSLLYFRTIMNHKEKLLVSIAMVLMISALILTFSKTNMLALAVGVLLSLFLRWGSRLIQLLTALALPVLLAYLAGVWDIFFKYAISSKTLREIASRSQLMRDGIEGFLYKHPFIGVGPGRGAKYTGHVMAWPTHNAFILAADEVGIFGLLAFCSIFIYGFLRIIVTIPSIKDPKEKTILKILLVGLAAYVVNIQFQPDFLSYYNWIYIGLIESSVIVFKKSSRVQLTKSPPC